MKHAQAFLFTILVTIILASTVTSNTAVSNEVTLKKSAHGEFAISYEEFSPIDIDNDTHFHTVAGNNGWDGDGSIDTPYIIENYNITADGNLIDIRDVSLYFIIRGCHLNETPLGRGDGIYFSNVDHARVENTTITQKRYGIYASNAPNLVVDNCSIFDTYRGIFYSSSTDVVISNCRIFENSDMGVFAGTNSNFTEVYDNWLYSNGNDGFYASYCHNSTLQNNTIYDNDYVLEGCGVRFHNVEFWEVADNHVYENTRHGISVYFSDYVDIHDNDIHNNTEHGVGIHNSNNCTVADNEVYQNRGESGVFCGIYILSSMDSLVRNNVVYNNSKNGIYLSYSDNITIVDNHVYNNTRYGVYAEYSEHCTISGNEIHGNEGKVPIFVVGHCGVRLFHAHFTEVIGNEIYNNTNEGIYVSYTNNCTFEDNIIYENARHGVYAVQSHNGTLFNNTIYANPQDGFRMSDSENWTITWNVIYDNDQYGIYLIETDECYLYYNDIGWNRAGNAIDTAVFSNYWNKSTIGNWWSDYVGTGDYVIPGAGSGVDYYPSINLNMTPADPTGYEFVTAGHLMPWWSQALNPWKYEVLRNGSQYATGNWPGTMFDVPIDGFPVGVHNVTLILYHVSGHFIWNQSIVEVEDTVGPSWDVEPENQFAELGESFSYQISAIDPSGISEYSIVGNDSFTIDSTGLISNATNLDFLDDYSFEIRASDPYDNLLTKTITITVQDTTAPYIEEAPSDFEFSEDATGVSIEWVASDYMLAGYELYLNGTILHEDVVTDTTVEISIDLDDLDLGLYNITILFYDSSGNNATDTVWVTVTASTVTTTPTDTTTDTNTTENTEPVDPLVILSIGSGGIIIVVAVVIIYAKKKG